MGFPQGLKRAKELSSRAGKERLTECGVRGEVKLRDRSSTDSLCLLDRDKIILNRFWKADSEISFSKYM